MKLNLKKDLGAYEASSTQMLTLYIPSQDRDGNPVNSVQWIGQAAMLLNTIGGGATQFDTTGSWLNPETGTQVTEQITIIYSYVTARKIKAFLPELNDFVQRLGRQTNQGEVVVEFSNRLYKIRFS